jgi:predicted MPP superfamily phosphohydrolase
MFVVDFALFLAAAVGHIGLLSYSLNKWYSTALPHEFLTRIRHLHGLLVAGGMAAFGVAWLLGFSPLTGLSSTNTWEMLASVYVLFCAFVGVVVVPLTSLWHQLHRKPSILLSNHTQMVDVAAALGYRPVGRGRYQRLCSLPGNQVLQVDLVERTLRLPTLPAAWDSLTILHLSDLHLCGCPDRKYFQHVMDLCNAWEPDLVAVTGDIVDSEAHHRWILPVLGRLRWRIAAYGILGNHDGWYDVGLIRRRMRRLGFRMLDNTWEQTTVRGEPLIVIGHEGPWFRPEPNLSNCPESGFRLCLSHTPDNIRWAQRHHIDLMLAGHVHGGQIRFPLIGSVLVPSRYSRRYDCGTFYEPPTTMHVSRGLGGRQPLRYNCRPEVTRLVLASGG